MSREIEQQLIELRAYRIWEEQGRPDGQHDQHWSQAQQQLREESEQDTGAFQSLPGAVHTREREADQSRGKPQAPPSATR